MPSGQWSADGARGGALRHSVPARAPTRPRRPCNTSYNRVITRTIDHISALYFSFLHWQGIQIIYKSYIINSVAVEVCLMSKLRANEKRDLFKAMQKQGYEKAVIRRTLQRLDADTLRSMLVNARNGLPVAGRPGPSKGHLGALAQGAKRESKDFLGSESAQELVRKAGLEKGKGTVLFSFKIGTKDLDQLRAISEHDGESVALLLRQAVRMFLASRSQG